MHNQERTQKPEHPRNEHGARVDVKNDETRPLLSDQHEAMDDSLPPINEAIPLQVSFDRYDAIGLLLLMYGWWKLLEHSWAFAIVPLAIGWLLAFATGPKRELFIRVVSGISADAVRVGHSLAQKVLSYIAAKKKDQSGNDGK